MAGYCVCKDFTLWSLPYTIDGVELNAVALQANSTHVSPIVGQNLHPNAPTPGVNQVTTMITMITMITMTIITMIIMTITTITTTTIVQVQMQ
jgi:hypothetical protein